MRPPVATGTFPAHSFLHGDGHTSDFASEREWGPVVRAYRRDVVGSDIETFAAVPHRNRSLDTSRCHLSSVNEKLCDRGLPIAPLLRGELDAHRTFALGQRFGRLRAVSRQAEEVVVEARATILDIERPPRSLSAHRRDDAFG